MMRIAVRADASVRIGTGHVMRCLALAGALRDGGAEVRFICRAHPGHMTDRIKADGFAVSSLTAPDPDDTSWLGAPVEADAAETVAALDGWRPDWLVVDHYALGAHWERAVRPHAGAVLAVDDLADRAHDCDVLLDQNHHPEAEARYAGLVPEGCRLLCGPRFSLMRPEYAAMRRLLDGPRDGTVARVLVYYGGVDATNETARALRVLSEPAFSALAVDVVVGANHPDRADIEALVTARPNTTLHGPRLHLADLMARADLALGAGGATTWERCCLGLPALVTVMADNQESLSESVQRTGATRILGRGGALSTLALHEALSDLCRDPAGLAGQSRAAWALCDGRGARQCAAILRLAGRPDTTPLIPRPLPAEGRRVQFTVTGSDALDPPLAHLTVEPSGNRLSVAPSIEGGLGGLIAPERLRAAAVLAWRDHHDALVKDLAPENPYLALADADADADAEGRSGGGLRITVLSDRRSWQNPAISGLLAEAMAAGHAVRWVHHPRHLVPGDICFLLGCQKIVTAEHRALHMATVVVHASDLPRGRGWSPWTWRVLEGANHLTVSLLAAEDPVDSGNVFLQTEIDLDGTELVGDLRQRIAEATRRLCRQFLDAFPDILAHGRPQAGDPTWYSRRRPADSELDPAQPLESQFNLLRVADSVDFPAYFRMNGCRYVLRIAHGDETE